MTRLKKFVDGLNSGEFTLLAIVALIFILAIGIYVGKTGVLISQFFTG